MGEIIPPVMLALVTAFALFMLVACTPQHDNTYKGVACVLDHRC